MNEDKYLAESGGFDNGGYHSHKVDPSEMDAMLNAASVATNWADRVKRSLFYGADMTPKAMSLPTSLTIEARHRDMVHGILGLFTEAGELMQHLHDVMTGRAAVDEVNVVEELGDCYWYMALLHRITGTKPSQAWEANIAKLKARYPERFNEYDALNRNLAHERNVLECHIGFDAGEGK